MILYLIEMQLHALVIARYKLAFRWMYLDQMYRVRSVLGSPSNSYIFFFFYFIQPAGWMRKKNIVWFFFFPIRPSTHLMWIGEFSPLWYCALAIGRFSCRQNTISVALINQERPEKLLVQKSIGRLGAHIHGQKFGRSLLNWPNVDPCMTCFTLYLTSVKGYYHCQSLEKKTNGDDLLKSIFYFWKWMFKNVFFCLFILGKMNFKIHSKLYPIMYKKNVIKIFAFTWLKSVQLHLLH